MVIISTYEFRMPTFMLNVLEYGVITTDDEHDCLNNIVAYVKEMIGDLKYHWSFSNTEYYSNHPHFYADSCNVVDATLIVLQ